MNKDIDKLLSRTLFTYGIILSLVFILKIFGVDYFGLDTKNEIIVGINNFVTHWRLENVWYAITLYINGYIIMSITCNDNSKDMKKFVLCCLPLFLIFQWLKSNYNIPFLFIVVDLLYLFILSICYIKSKKKCNIKKENVSNYFLLVFMINLFQIMSLTIRNLAIQNQPQFEDDFIVNIIINFDYLILTIMTYHLYFLKGGISLWDLVHSSFSDLLTSLKTLPTKLLKSYQDAKPKVVDEEQVIANKIYLVLFWLYNFFTLLVILLIATLNHTFIECIFIVTSFWINKAVFGKAFHLKTAKMCFIVSSLSYYTLNRLTWKIGISFLIPITLGISLSYITSKFMARQENIYLYRGMPLDKFNQLIRRVCSDELKIDICKRFYVDRKSDIEIANAVCYSVANIKKIKKDIRDKIKEL